MEVEESRAQEARPTKRLNRSFWMGFVGGIFALIVIGGLLGFLLSPELLKHRSPFPLEEAIGASRVSAAIDGSYKNKANPVAVNDENQARGKQVFNANCAFCHGVSGKGDAAIGRNMFPPAANLLEGKTVDKTDGEIFWILENGLAFVGMPSFKSTLNEQDTWKAILYVRALQKGTADKVGVVATPAATTAAATTAASNATPAATTAANATTAASGSDDLARGLAIFRNQGCAACHGGDKATGGLGPNIAGIAFPVEGLIRQVRGGGGAMPAFSATQLPDADVKLIYAYLQSLK